MLVVAPHADDETIGAYVLMMRLRRRGVAIRVLVVTDGHASHPASVRWPRRRLVRERQRETRRAVGRIGVPVGCIRFLDLPDGGLGTVSSVATRLIARAMAAAPRPLLVVAPAVGDDHPDHRVVAAAVAAGRTPGMRRLSYPVWPAGGALRGGARSLYLTTQERLAKRHAIRSYATQVGRIVDDPSGFAMTRRQIAAFSRPTETFLDHRR